MKNTGKVRHELSTPDKPAVDAAGDAAARRHPPAALRRPSAAYVIRDSEYPHIMISVIIVGTTYFSAVDDKGAFSIANVPDGNATLKVWTRGKWVDRAADRTGTLGKEELTIRVASRASS